MTYNQINIKKILHIIKIKKHQKKKKKKKKKKKVLEYMQDPLKCTIN